MKLNLLVSMVVVVATIREFSYLNSDVLLRKVLSTSKAVSLKEFFTLKVSYLLFQETFNN